MITMMSITIQNQRAIARVVHCITGYLTVTHSTAAILGRDSWRLRDQLVPVPLQITGCTKSRQPPTPTLLITYLVKIL